MNVVVIANIYNTPDMANKRGWVYGYRVIDTDTEKVEDISAESIKEKLMSREWNIHNLEVCNSLEKSESVSENSNGLKLIWAGKDIGTAFPKIVVSTEEEKVEHPEGEPEEVQKWFLVSICSDLDVGRYYRLCDCTGKKKKFVHMDEITIISRYGTGPQRIMNTGEGFVHRDVLGSIQIEDGFEQPEIKEYYRRCKMLGLARIYMTDLLKREGVGMVGCDKDIAGVVTVPDYVVTIMPHAFEGLRNLRKVILGKGVKSIARLAFDAIELDELVLNEGLERIRSEAFGDTIIHEPFVIPSTVYDIVDDAFLGIKCTELVIKSNVLGETVEGLDWVTFLPATGIKRFAVSKDAAKHLLKYMYTHAYIPGSIEDIESKEQAEEELMAAIKKRNFVLNLETVEILDE